MENTNSDVKESIKSLLRDIQRLEEGKVDKGWIKGKLEVIMQRVDVLNDSLRALDIEVAEAAKIGAMANKRAEENSRIVSKGYSCVHEEHISSMAKKIDQTADSVNDWNVTIRKFMTKSFVTIVSAIIVFGGAMTGWLVMHNNLQRDVEEVKADSLKDRAVLVDVKESQELLQETLKKNEASQVENIKEAFRSVIVEMKKTE